MSTTGTGIEARLALAQIAIVNASADPTLSTALAAYGYTIERLREGSALHERAYTLHQRRNVEYGNLLAANDTREQAQHRAQDTYMRQVKVARIALKNNRGALQKLNLVGARKRAQLSWLAQAQQFYANALFEPEILARLNAFGITQVQLTSSQNQINLVATSHATRQQRKGAAQDATHQRDLAMAALDSWMGDFVKIARVALQDRPQLLEKIGVAVSVRRAARHSIPTAALAATMPISATLTSVAESAAVVAEPAVGPTAERRNGRAEANGQPA